MRVDFYQLTRDPVEKALAMLARASLGQGQRMLIVAGDESRLGPIGDALWSEFPGSFLAHGIAGGPDDARQPILLATDLKPANGARYVALADGRWREALDSEDAPFERVFYLFDEATIDAARGAFRMLGARAETERHYWAQDGGKWVRKA